MELILTLWSDQSPSFLQVFSPSSVNWGIICMAKGMNIVLMNIVIKSIAGSRYRGCRCFTVDYGLLGELTESLSALIAADGETQILAGERVRTWVGKLLQALSHAHVSSVCSAGEHTVLSKTRRPKPFTMCL